MPLRPYSPHLFALTLALGLGACAPDLETGDGSGDDEGAPAGDDGSDLPDDPNMEHSDEGDYFMTRVDASDQETWIYLDLDLWGQVDPDAPSSDVDWDLRFLRFNVALNGGVSGPGGVEAVWLPETSLGDVQSAPASGFGTDQPDGDDEDSDDDLFFADWYDYDITTHVLTPKSGVYVVRTPTAAYAVEIVDYYNDAGTSGYPTFAWKPLEG